MSEDTDEKLTRFGITEAEFAEFINRYETIDRSSSKEKQSDGMVFTIGKLRV